MHRTLVALAALFIASLPAQAFRTPKHGAETETLAKKLGYDSTCAKVLNKGNRETDGEDKKLPQLALFKGTPAAPIDAKGRPTHLFDYPPAHFDSETFALGSRRLRHTFTLVFQQLEKGNRENALWLMGSSLHSIQDFFSHSNFIELGRKSIDLYALSDPLPSLICRPGQKPNALTSGYWPDNAPVKNKCHHKDLNKDSTEHPLHAKAFKRAIEESTRFFAKVEAEVKRRYPSGAADVIRFLKNSKAKAPDFQLAAQKANPALEKCMNAAPKPVPGSTMHSKRKKMCLQAHAR